MKPLICIGILISLPAMVWAQDYIKKDPINEDRYNIYRDGKRTGHLRNDSLFENRVNEYDRDGRLRGYWREDSISEGRYNRYEDGRQGGYLKRGPLFEDRINQYDSDGRLKGYWREDPLTDDRYNFEADPDYGR